MWQLSSNYKTLNLVILIILSRPIIGFSFPVPIKTRNEVHSNNIISEHLLDSHNFEPNILIYIFHSDEHNKH